MCLSVDPNLPTLNRAADDTLRDRPTPLHPKRRRRENQSRACETPSTGVYKPTATQHETPHNQGRQKGAADSDIQLQNLQEIPEIAADRQVSTLSNKDSEKQLYLLALATEKGKILQGCLMLLACTILEKLEPKKG